MVMYIVVQINYGNLYIPLFVKHWTYKMGGLVKGLSNQLKNVYVWKIRSRLRG